MTRNIVRLIDFMPVYYMIGLIVMFIDQKSRRLGDLAANTVVVKEQKGIKLDTLDRDAGSRQTTDQDYEAQRTCIKTRTGTAWRRRG